MSQGRNVIKFILCVLATLRPRVKITGMKTLATLFLGLVLILSLACAGEGPAAPTPESNLEATVQAAVSAALPTPTPTPPPDINATIAAGMEATRAAAPTLTPTPQPTPNLDATVEARMAATIAAMPTPTPTPRPTKTPKPSPTLTPTPVPTATPTPTPTPVPTATPTRRPTPRPRPTATPTPKPTPNPAVLLSEMVRRARPAVVRIETRTGSGSGAIFETQGQTAYLITNQHVVEGAAEVSVTVNDSSTYRGVVLGTDSVRDLAVVKICCGSFRKLAFGDASRLEPGDEVVAIGYALGLSGEATITRGIVSAIRYDTNHRSDVIQTDAAINPGNSGGPMLSMSGEILGINTFRFTATSDGRPVDRLGFAISATTVKQRISELKTAQAAPTPTPTRRPTPTPSSGGSEYGFEPRDGELYHDPSDGYIETEYAYVFMSDMMVWATFFNPYSVAGNSWDYGFIFRDSGAESSARYLQVVVTSRGRWEASWREGRSSESETIAEGTLGRFDTSRGGQNILAVLAVGARGVLFVNREFVSTLDLSSVTEPGDVAVITGAFTGNEVTDAVTRFENFTGVRLQKKYGPADGKLGKETGIVSEHESGVWARDIVAEAEFTSPPGSRWSYGFIIRNPESSRLEVIGVTGNNKWFHKTRDVGDEEYTDVGEGRLRISSKNHILLWALAEGGLLFVNGEMVARLDLSYNLDYGSVSTMGGFYSDHIGEPEFENFNVWTFPDP